MELRSGRPEHLAPVFATPGHTAPVNEEHAVTAAGLRAESDQFHAHLQRLAELEDRKRELSPVDPDFVSLAREVEDLAASVLADARGQTEFGVAAHQEGVETPIVDVPEDAT